MKKYILLFVLAMGVASAHAQGFELRLEQNVQGDYLMVDVYIEGTAGLNFDLGSSSFVLDDNSGNLDIANALLIDSLGSDFNGAGYKNLGFYAGEFIHLYTKRSGTGSVGVELGSYSHHIGTIAIPILDHCGTSNLHWLTDRGVINSYDKENIKSLATYKTPNIAGFVSDIDVSVTQNGNILSIPEQEGSTQWYYNGLPIDGMTGATCTMTEKGDYEVEVSNACETQRSGVISTQEKHYAGLEISSSPNPFTESTTISYTVNKDADVTIDVYDVMGNKLGTLVEGYHEKGEYEENLDASSLNETGVYFVKLMAGDNVKTQRVMVLK